MPKSFDLDFAIHYCSISFSNAKGNLTFAGYFLLFHFLLFFLLNVVSDLGFPFKVRFGAWNRFSWLPFFVVAFYHIHTGYREIERESARDG